VTFRVLDFLLSLIGLVLGAPVLFMICVLGALDTGAPLFYQVRVGRNQKPFMLVKFRTMRLGTGNVPTHMVSASAITPLGSFLRRTKLDELPQLWNVLVGEMSLVGPRPGLPCHVALIEARASKGVFDARPGITGLAQLQGVDMSTPELLAEVDARMLGELTVARYVKLLVATALGGGSGDRIRG